MVKSDPKKVLIVEDSKELREMYKTRLEMEHYKTYEASDGSEGLRKVDRVQPDLILLDLMMPNIDGVEFLEIIKGVPETDSIPVVVMTAYPARQSEISHLGVDHFLAKSETTIEDMVKIVNSTLEK